MKAEIHLPVVSSAGEGLTGNWSYRITRELPARPHSGDRVQLAPGWSSQPVRDVDFTAETDGTTGLVATLHPVRTDSPVSVRELDKIREWGWERLAGPWDESALP